MFIWICAAGLVLYTLLIWSWGALTIILLQRLGPCRDDGREPQSGPPHYRKNSMEGRLPSRVPSGGGDCVGVTVTHGPITHPITPASNNGCSGPQQSSHDGQQQHQQQHQQQQYIPGDTNAWRAYRNNCNPHGGSQSFSGNSNGNYPNNSKQYSSVRPHVSRSQMGSNTS